MGSQLEAPAETRWPLTVPALTAPLGTVTSSDGRLSGFSHFLSLRRDLSAPSRPRSGSSPALAFLRPTQHRRLASSAWSHLSFRLSLDRLWVSMLSFSRAG